MGKMESKPEGMCLMEIASVLKGEVLDPASTPHPAAVYFIQ